MKALWISLGIVFVLGVVFFIRKKRKKAKETFFSGEKHPNGFQKYHRQTKLRVKRALLKQEGSKSIVVLSFKGEIHASSRFSLSRCIDEILLNKEKISEVILKVESRGGGVTEYGHAYSEVKRLRDQAIPLCVCIDNVAASGGYLMSLPANRIYAAPFSMVGSIGVMSFVPNIRKLLEDFKIEPRTFTSGKFKRTVSMTDEASDEEIAHYNKQLELIHDQFKNALKKFRPNVDLEKVATGEAWLAQSTHDLQLGLVDELQTSSELLLNKNRDHDLVELFEETKIPPIKRFLKAISTYAAS